MTVRWLLVSSLVLAACAGDGPAVVASAAVLTADQAPAGTVHVATVSWEEVRTGLGEAAAEAVAELDDLGLREATLSIFVGGVASDDEPVDLAGMGRVRVSGAVTFVDGDAAAVAINAIEQIAADYVGQYEATLQALDAGDVNEGARGGLVNASEFPGTPAAIVWVERDVVMLAFAQGGDGPADVMVMAETMTGERR